MSSSQRDTRETGSWESLPNAKGDMEVPVLNTVFLLLLNFFGDIERKDDMLSFLLLFLCLTPSLPSYPPFY
jgi:hypothetical protein